MRKLFAALGCGVVLAGLISNSALAAEGLDARTRALWQRHWRVYAQRCAEFEGDFLCAPSYNKRYPSSAGLTVRQASAQLSVKIKVTGLGIVVPKTIRMPLAEAKAMALPIPKLAVGQYGYLVSAEVDEVLGPTSMQVKNLYLIDPVALRKDYLADRAKVRRAKDAKQAEAELEYVYRYRNKLSERHKDKRHRKVVLRLEGFSTDGLIAGDRWAGPKGEGFQILIVKPETYGNKRRSKQRLVAVSLKQVRFGLDKSAFIRLLQARGMTPRSFVELVMEKMSKAEPEAARASVFYALLATRDTSGDSDESKKTDETSKQGVKPVESDAGPG